jgi:exodeoxyribonuclease VII large subunit
VGEVVRLAGRALEARFGDVWVEGEISNFKVVSGNAYFTLKDSESQLPAVLFRSAAQRVRFRPTDGLKVRARGRLSIYDAQGKFQLYVEELQPSGVGALLLALEQLKQKLQAEGLFDAARKRPLPFLPRRIGVATSATGAAVRDIIRVAELRGPSRIVVAHCQVQGEEAPADIVAAIRALERQPDVDLIIVGRGGGSAEDLWAFNDERVARAIAACRVPVVSAVGHEVDFTIADFVADRRAATPSQAAEFAVPVHRELETSLGALLSRLRRAGERAVGDARQRLHDADSGLGGELSRRMSDERRRLRALDLRLGPLHPSVRITRDRATLAVLARRLERPLPERIVRGRRALEPLARRLGEAAEDRITSSREALGLLERRLHAAMQQALTGARRDFAAAAGTLDALSPLKVLERGYGLVRDGQGRVVTHAAQLGAGERFSVRFARGEVRATALDSIVDPSSPEEA